MGPRLIILVIALGIFSFGFYLMSYQKDFDSNKPLNMKLLSDLEKASHHVEHDEASATSETPKVVVIDMNDPVIKSGHAIYHEKGQCMSCHGDVGQGNPEKLAPMLAGQHEWYVASQLKAFKNGERKNDAMLPFLKDLSEKDFSDVAEYIKFLRVPAEEVK